MGKRGLLRRLAHWLAVGAVVVIGVSWLAPLAHAADGLVFLQPTAQVEGNRRVALVVGNGAYAHVPTLKNTVNDADAVATKLRGLGYQIEFAQNVDRRSMNEAIMGFLARIEPGTQAAVFYAGHGVELNGANYLLPTDIPALVPDQERMLRTEGVNLNDLLLDITDRHAGVTLVILDACRDNPFYVAGTHGTYRSLGASRGLATVSPPSGSFVIFSAGAGEEALDNLGSADASPNGLFTRKLLALMDKDGLELRDLVRQLRVEVSEAAATTPDHHHQVPGYYDQMIGDFYFRPRDAELHVASPTVSLPLDPVVPPQPSPAIEKPQPNRKFAYANPTPPDQPVRPVVCKQGEKLRGGSCQKVACADGKIRNSKRTCSRTGSRLGNNEAIKKTSPQRRAIASGKARLIDMPCTILGGVTGYCKNNAYLLLNGKVIGYRTTYWHHICSSPGVCTPLLHGRS